MGADLGQPRRPVTRLVLEGAGKSAQEGQIWRGSGSLAGKSRFGLQAVGSHGGLWAETRGEETSKGPQCRRVRLR